MGPHHSDGRPTNPYPNPHRFSTHNRPQVPYNGGPGAFGTVQLMPVEDTLRDWAVNKDGCTAGPTVTFRNHSATCRTWSACKGGAEVVLCSLEGVSECVCVWGGGSCEPWDQFFRIPNQPVPHPPTITTTNKQNGLIGSTLLAGAGVSHLADVPRI